MKLLSYLVMFSFLLAACSTSQPKSGDSSVDGSADLLESSADEVGSAPEDLLSEETGGAQQEDAAADPFADLKNDSDMNADFQGQENSTAAMEVAEEPSPVDAPYSGGGTEIYTVKAGDTLMKIAFNIYGDLSRWRDLHTWNQDKLNNANELKRGMQIKYEAPSIPFNREQLAHSYKIKKGDTLAGIADDVYGRRMKYRKLQNYNKNLIKNPHKIFAGFTIFYEITPQEMAEAEARRREKMAAQQPAGSGMNDFTAVRAEPIEPPAMSDIKTSKNIQQQPNPIRVPVATTPPPVPTDMAPMPPTAPGR